MYCAFAILTVYELDWNAQDGHDWFPYDHDTVTVFNFWSSNTMSRRLPNASGESIAIGNIRAIYAYEFAYRGLTLE